MINQLKFKSNSTSDFSILQLTDLHLMQNEKDELTFDLIKRLVLATHPDLIVITGDLTMHSDSISLYAVLGKHLEKFKIPFTYVFGNHDTEGSAIKEELIQAIAPYKFNFFPKNKEDIFDETNYKLSIFNNINQMIWSLFFFDSNNTKDYLIEEKKVWGYDTIHKNQVNWYSDQVKKLPIISGKICPSIAFFHIPLPEFQIKSPLKIGNQFENPCVPLENTGLFQQMKKYSSTKGVFVGHDHYNDFQFIHDEILLAYGRVTGYYDYLDIIYLRGARLINLHQDGSFDTKIILENEV
ncbi:MAG: metallophosphoesterase family protein [Firmicutes bacterium]|nr:metallophosphoesterase family protein [Bacillota bacterium]